MVEQTCHCGKKFQAKPADIKRGWAKCCSKKCAARLREQKTGTHKRFCQSRDAAEKHESFESMFSNAHLFADCADM